MINLNRHFPIFRTITFLTVLLLAIPCLAISASIIHSRGDGNAILGIVASAVSVVVLSILYLVDTVALAVELALLSVTWILWLVHGAILEAFWWGARYHQDFAAVGAMSLFIFSILMLYTVILATLSVSAHSRGARNVWRTPAKTFDWNEGSSPGPLRI